MRVWIKPSGIEVETNNLPDTIAAAKAAGWKEKKKEVKEESKKATKKTKG